MSTETSAVSAQRQRSDDPQKAIRFQPGRGLIGLLGMLVVVWFLANLFLAFGYYPQWFGNKAIIGIIALIAGVGGAFALFWFLNMFVEALPQRFSLAMIPYAFLLPAFALVAVVLLYPTIQTINYSFANADSTAYVGLDNYQTIFTDAEFWSSVVNNILWLLIVPAVTVALGVVIAVLADKLSDSGERTSKGLIFLPMAISFVAATAVWGLIYAYNPPVQAQTGLLNAIVVGLGGSPQTWLAIETAKLNSLLLMVIMIWMQAGFAMVLLSAAIKGVPEDTLEAARIDGASDFQIFRLVVVPQIRSTIVTVYVTIFILVLKVFDIVYVSTNGNYDTNVLANLYFNKLFAGGEAGIASAIVVVLLVAVSPLIWFQIRIFREGESR